jgi:hypothetical protein
MTKKKRGVKCAVTHKSYKGIVFYLWADANKKGKQKQK